MTRTFSLRFFAWPRRQLADARAAQDIAAGPMDPLFHAAVARLAAGEAPPEPRWGRGWPYARLLWAVRPLVGRAALWGVASRLAVLGTVFIATRLFHESGGWGQALALSFGYFAAQALGNVTQYFADVNRSRMDQAVAGHLLGRLAAKLPHLDPQASQGFSKGRIKVLAVSDVQELVEFTNTLFWNLIPALGTVVILGPVAYGLTGVPGLLAIATAFLNVPVALWLSRLIARMQKRGQDEMDAMTTLLGEWVRNVRLVRYLSWQKAFERDIGARLRAYMRPYLWRHAMMCVTFGISFSWWMVPIVVLFLSSRWLGQALILETFFATLWILKDLGDYLSHLPHAINLRASAMVSMRRFDEFAALPETRHGFEPYAGPLPAPDAVPVAVRAENVAVAFPDEQGPKWALRDVSKTFHVGRRYAVTGPVGSGKSVLLKLLAGEVKPSAGRMEVLFSDGTRAPLWAEAVHGRWRQAVATLPADPFISNGSLAANVSLSEAEAEAAGEELLHALHMADLMADAASFPRGVREEVGEVGINLSGGQKLRLALARALYARRSFLLLDDPLSAVDQGTEAVLMGHLGRSGRGFVMATHRLAHVGELDEVLHLTDGALTAAEERA